MGLIPGVGTIGWGHDINGHFHLDRPLIRPFNSDFNGTIALALISFGAWLIIVLKFAGPAVIAKDLFGNKAEKSETPGWLYPILSLVFLVVGLIEVFSIVIRPFTLSVRLFGNVFGEETVIVSKFLLPAGNGNPTLRPPPTDVAANCSLQRSRFAPEGRESCRV